MTPEPKDKRPKFNLGRTVMTRAASVVLTQADVMGALLRHARGDWGDIDPADEGLNDQALIDGERLLSVYAASDGTRFWVITEHDRSATTVLLPDDY